MGLPAEDILMVHMADGQMLEHHCPNFVLLRVPDHQQESIL
jgi:hypothetical protein